MVVLLQWHKIEAVHAWSQHHSMLGSAGPSSSCNQKVYLDFDVARRLHQLQHSCEASTPAGAEAQCMSRSALLSKSGAPIWASCLAEHLLNEHPAVPKGSLRFCTGSLEALLQAVICNTHDLLQQMTALTAIWTGRLGGSSSPVGTCNRQNS